MQITQASSLTQPFAGSTPSDLAGASFARADRERAHVPTVRRIIHLSKHCVDGNGNVHVAVDLACLQAAAGCEVLFVSRGGTYEPLLEAHSVRHFRLEQDPKKPFQSLRTIWKLTGLARSFRPDVLHAHMMGSAVVGSVASRLTGVPLVTTVHNSFESHSRLMRLGKRIVAVSDAEKLKLIERGFEAKRMDAVMNAPLNSPREQFRKNAVDPILHSPCISTVCGLHRRKGVFDLLEACAELFREMPEWRLYIAGDGPDRAALEQQAISTGVGERIIFLGAVPAPRVLYRQTDIFTLCSYADPCSLVIGEARGAGCAIVATAVGGTPEMLEFGRAGRLVSPGKPEQLAEQLRILMRDPEERKRLRHAAREGSEVFKLERLLLDYDSVYRRAIVSR